MKTQILAMTMAALAAAVPAAAQPTYAIGGAATTGYADEQADRERELARAQRERDEAAREAAREKERAAREKEREYSAYESG